MKRLTCNDRGETVLKAMLKKDYYVNCMGICEKFEGGCTECPIQKAFERLSAYEDTGITPEQIVEIDKLYAEKCREAAGLQKELENLKRGKIQNG